MGGTIKFVPQAPVIGKFATSAKVGVEATEGGNESTSFNGMINIPLIDGKLALRLVGSVVDRGGWIDRGVVNDFPLPDPSITGSYFTAPRADLSGVTPDKVYKNTNTVRSDTFRAAVLWQPTDRLTITPSFFYQKIRTGAPDSYDESPGTDVHYQPFDIKETYGDEAKIATVKGQYSFDDFDLNSVTSYARRRQTQVQDSSEGLFKSNADFEGLTGYAIADGGLGQASTTESQPVTQFTQEIRLTSTTQSDFSWIVGAYYNRFTSHYQAISITPDAGPILGTTVGYSADLADESSEVAVFASLGYQLTPKLKVTVGARQYSYLDNVSGETGGILGGGVIDAKKAKTSGVNPSFNLSYTPSSNHLLYASVAKGMRQGAAQPATPHICDADVTALGLSEAPTRFDPDYVWNYELGSKNQYFNRKLTLNAAIYRMKWQGVQQYVALPQCGFTYTDNAGEVTVNGVDFEFDARLPAGFGLSGSVGYVDAAFDRDDPRTGTMAGDPLQNVPEWTGNVAFTYDKDFGSDYALKARLGASHVGGSRVVSYDKFQLDGYTLVDGRIGIGKGKWLVSMYVDNLTNERVVLNRPLALTFNVPRLDRLQSSRPRTVGIEFTIKQ
ncbi:hypothetical protein ABENE_21530 [Asticcacaulis benevestitus DSM 16100 = ATCC BAA-896]|uniref:TonB-dependent receptor-like beta-barrel domain-containing protein n=2 Tax=Asticcacaulis TaxID=76890 RepID=V4P3J3_9CAUL|nr:hypothetical protein ABENE_21530 [Asticcacaulis benevestitus DSM 16100 = ATCC BAA-896]